MRNWSGYCGHRPPAHIGASVEDSEMADAMIDTAALAASLQRIAVGAATAAAELNSADGQLGDGDLGITVSKGFAEAAAMTLPADVGMALLECAKAFQRVSSSSYGTLVATGFMAAAKAL